jgi:hypothetical protein
MTWGEKLARDLDELEAARAAGVPLPIEVPLVRVQLPAPDPREETEESDVR